MLHIHSNYEVYRSPWWSGNEKNDLFALLNGLIRLKKDLSLCGVDRVTRMKKTTLGR